MKETSFAHILFATGVPAKPRLCAESFTFFGGYSRKEAQVSFFKYTGWLQNWKQRICGIGSGGLKTLTVQIDEKN
jgi:hypothetical protein